MNFELYNLTSQYFPKNIQYYAIDGRNGMYGMHSLFYMFRKLKDFEVDWLIMADEDVFFSKPKSVVAIIEKMIKENYTVVGVRDGGAIAHRNYNP